MWGWGWLWLTFLLLEFQCFSMCCLRWKEFIITGCQRQPLFSLLWTCGSATSAFSSPSAKSWPRLRACLDSSEASGKAFCIFFTASFFFFLTFCPRKDSSLSEQEFPFKVAEDGAYCSRILWNWFCCKNKCRVPQPDSINRSSCTTKRGAGSRNRHAVMDPERQVKVKLFVFQFSFHLLLYSCESKLDDLLFLISRIFF